MEEHPIARHLLVELGGCDAARLDDPDVVRAAIRAGASAAGTRLLSEVVHRFEPVGVTGIGLLAESHLAVHTWPERGYAAVDLLTCHTEGDLQGVVDELREAFGATTTRVELVSRRVPSP